MKSFKLSRTRSSEILLLAAIIAIVVLIAAQNLFSQINISPVIIDGIKRSNVPKVKQQSPNAVDRPGSRSSEEARDDPPDWFVNVMVSDIEKAREEVESYTPAGKIYLVSTPSAPWLLRAVSAKEREAYAIDKKFNDWRKMNAGNKYDSALNTLAAAASSKLPIYIPKPALFALRDATIEQAMKAKLKNAATLRISKIGVLHANWQIEKNDLGIPTNRYREAFVWGRDTSDDHPHCHVYGFVIQQDYAGGGTYGASFVYQNTDVLFGCPATGS